MSLHQGQSEAEHLYELNVEGLTVVFFSMFIYVKK